MDEPPVARMWGTPPSLYLLLLLLILQSFQKHIILSPLLFLETFMVGVDVSRQKCQKPDPSSFPEQT